MHARVTRGAKGDHEVRILDTGSVVNDNPVPAAADPASMSIPRKDVLPMPSEALQGVPALVVAGKAQAGRLKWGGHTRRMVRTAIEPGQPYGTLYPTGKKRRRSRVSRVSSQAQVYFLGTLVTVC
jgi:hypothetical protein